MTQGTTPRSDRDTARGLAHGAGLALLWMSLASPACAPAGQIELKLLVGGLARPVDLVTAPGDPRLYIVEQLGRVRVYEHGVLRREPFLDVGDRISHGNEQGLLSVAFHPRYATNGLVYINYTDRDGNTNVVRYRVRPDRTAVDASTASRILFVEQPYANHNGGHLLFGPDSMLYIPLGDGGAGGDPHGNGQNLNTLLGKLLRVDVDHGTPYGIPRDNPFASGRRGRPEIWATGLRNPWRISFDHGQLYIADVGQNLWEEIDVAPAREPGINYGWNFFEATHPYTPRPAPEAFPFRRPAIEYGHALGCCVIGGGVYHGSVEALRGRYLYSDACSSWIGGFSWHQGRAHSVTRWRTSEHISATAFGEDARGEMYVLDLGGKVYRISGVR